MTGSGILDFIISHCDKNSLDTVYRALALKWLNLVLKDIAGRQDGFHWRFLEETAQLSLINDTFNYALSTMASDIDTEKTINVYDKINDYPLDYVDYNIFRQRIAKETNDSGDPRIFSVYSQDLLLWPVPDFTPITGTADGTTSDKLVDSTADFEDDGIEVGMRVTNTTDSTYALVTAIDDANTLSLDSDIMVSGEGYSIAKCVHVDYVKVITAATDAATTLLVPDKYEKVVIDGMLQFAYQFDPELGSMADASTLYEAGIARMIRENQGIIAENVRPVSHRYKHKYRGAMDRKNSILFPLDSTSM